MLVLYFAQMLLVSSYLLVLVTRRVIMPTNRVIVMMHTQKMTQL
jgi:hypothetical protein